MDITLMASGLLSQVVAWATLNALLAGIAAIAAGIVARALGGRWGILLVAAAGAFAGTVALWDYQATGTLLVPAVLLAGGILAAALVGWLLRGVPMVGAVALFAAGWYLILYAFLGSFTTTSILGDLALGGLIMGSALVVHHAARMIENARRVPEPNYPQTNSV